MMNKKLFRNSLIFCLVILIFVGNNQAQAQSQEVNAYLGTISSDEINQGDTLSFSGSIYNNDNITYIVYAMNVTFIQILGESSKGEAEKFDYSIGYDVSGFRLDEKQIYTDNFDSKIDLNPGKYNVSIGFAANNGTVVSSEEWSYHYALVNQTVQVFGTTEAVNVAKIIGYALLAIVALIILYWVYTKFR